MQRTEPGAENLAGSGPGNERRKEPGNEPGYELEHEPSVKPSIVLSVIVPARDEEANLGACLSSLTAQSEAGWLLGEHWELLVVDDGSTDRTAEIARSLVGVTVLTAPTPLPRGWTGKANACWVGAEQASGQWLLFTDADTVHTAGSLSRGVLEAEKYSVAMLSYSPAQVVPGLLQRAVMPLVFSELATAYPAAQVNDPAKRIAGANGQFLLLRSDAYRTIGGHREVSGSLVEDVDLACLAKRSGLGLRFRYAPETVEARMYAGFGAMWQGWTKNLALLINNILPLAIWRLLDIAMLWGLPLLALLYPTPFVWVRLAFWLLWLRTVLRVYRRAARSNFATADVVLSLLLGLPLFAALAYASWYRVRMLRRASWKGREYPIQKRN
jgi:glycosyltransferase involved in cell wall biosynthesis